METIKKRAEFIASSKGDKFVTPSFIFLKHKLNGAYVNDPKVGYTASKKIGGAVMRNRAKRRMRFLAKEVLFNSAKPNTNYVIIARRKILEYPFSQMANDLKKII
jgi:ribonuclease P protein component